MVWLTMNTCVSTLELSLSPSLDRSVTMHVHFTLHSAHLSAALVPQGVHKTESHLTWWRSCRLNDITGWKRSKAFESPRQQQLQQQQNCEQTWSPQHIWSQYSSNIETGNGRCDTTGARRNERDSQWQNRHVEQHQHITAERVRKTSCFTAIPKERLHSKNLGRQQRQEILSALHVGLVFADASVVRRRITDKFDNSTLPVDCSDNEFRTIETSLDQILHRTTANEPLIIVQQARGQQGFKAWYAIVRRHGQKNMSDNNSTYAGSISKISERDRAEDVEQFDDVLSTCINDRNNFENRCCITRDEEKMVAVKKLMLESLLNFRFRGTTMSYDELLIALEHHRQGCNCPDSQKQADRQGCSGGNWIGGER